MLSEIVMGLLPMYLPDCQVQSDLRAGDEVLVGLTSLNARLVVIIDYGLGFGVRCHVASKTSTREAASVSVKVTAKVRGKHDTHPNKTSENIWNRFFSLQ